MTIQIPATFAPDGTAGRPEARRDAAPANAAPATNDDRYDDGLVHGHTWASSNARCV